jgi:hypothetical protein
MAQLVDALGLGVEPVAPALCQGDDLGQHRPALGFVLLGRVIDLAPEPERLREIGLCTLDRRREGGGCLVAELRGRKRELLLACLHRVVHLDKQAATALGKLVRGQFPDLVALRRDRRSLWPSARAGGEPPDEPEQREAPRSSHSHTDDPPPSPSDAVSPLAASSPLAAAIAAPAQSPSASSGSID